MKRTVIARRLEAGGLTFARTQVTPTPRPYHVMRRVPKAIPVGALLAMLSVDGLASAEADRGDVPEALRAIRGFIDQ